MKIILIGKKFVIGDLKINIKNWKNECIRFCEMNVKEPNLCWEDKKSILRCMQKKYQKESEHTSFERSLTIARNCLLYQDTAHSKFSVSNECYGKFMFMLFKCYLLYKVVIVNEEGIENI